MSIGKESDASKASKAKLRDQRKTGEFKKMLRPGLDSNRVEAKKGGKMNAGLKAFLAKKKKKKGKK
jgi:hypothetical protein|tara:strand:+ start:43 stop:240 length:198 start_codon:yes stop_codon:yes gene_type:complete